MSTVTTCILAYFGFSAIVAIGTYKLECWLYRQIGDTRTRTYGWYSPIWARGDRRLRDKLLTLTILFIFWPVSFIITYTDLGVARKVLRDKKRRQTQYNPESGL